MLSPILNSCVNYCTISCHYISSYVMPFCLLQSINYLLCNHILSHTILSPLSYHFHILLANDETATLAAKQCLTVMTTHSSTILKQYATALLLLLYILNSNLCIFLLYLSMPLYTFTFKLFSFSHLFFLPFPRYFTSYFSPSFILSMLHLSAPTLAYHFLSYPVIYLHFFFLFPFSLIYMLICVTFSSYLLVFLSLLHR